MLKLSSRANSEAGDGEQLGHRVAEAGQPAERPAGERQRDEPGDGDELEGDAVRQDRRRGRRSPAPGRPCRSGRPACPAYQSMLHPVSWKLDSRWSRRNAGPHTWAPMSPPVGVVSAKTRSPNSEVDDVHHDDGRDEQRQRGDRDADDPLGRPRPRRPTRPAGGRCAGRRGPATTARRAGIGSWVVRPVDVDVALDEVVGLGRRVDRRVDERRRPRRRAVAGRSAFRRVTHGDRK